LTDAKTQKKGKLMPEIEFDAATLAETIRDQEALPITDSEAETIARALETSHDDETFLENTLSAIRLIVDRLEHSTNQALNPAIPADPALAGQLACD
jgi:hypothetical protein